MTYGYRMHRKRVTSRNHPEPKESLNTHSLQLLSVNRKCKHSLRHLTLPKCKSCVKLDLSHCQVQRPAVKLRLLEPPRMSPRLVRIEAHSGRSSKDLVKGHLLAVVEPDGSAMSKPVLLQNVEHLPVVGIRVAPAGVNAAPTTHVLNKRKDPCAQTAPASEFGKGHAVNDDIGALRVPRTLQALVGRLAVKVDAKVAQDLLPHALPFGTFLFACLGASFPALNNEIPFLSGDVAPDTGLIGIARLPLVNALRLEMALRRIDDCHCLIEFV